MQKYLELDEIFDNSTEANTIEFVYTKNHFETVFVDDCSDQASMPQCNVESTTGPLSSTKRRLRETATEKGKIQRLEKSLILTQQLHDEREQNKLNRHQEKLKQRERFIHRLINLH